MVKNGSRVGLTQWLSGKESNCIAECAEEICLTALASSAVTVLMVPAPLIVTKMNT